MRLCATIVRTQWAWQMLDQIQMDRNFSSRWFQRWGFAHWRPCTPNYVWCVHWCCCSSCDLCSHGWTTSTPFSGALSRGWRLAKKSGIPKRTTRTSLLKTSKSLTCRCDRRIVYIGYSVLYDLWFDLFASNNFLRQTTHVHVMRHTASPSTAWCCKHALVAICIASCAQ